MSIIIGHCEPIYFRAAVLFLRPPSCFVFSGFSFDYLYRWTGDDLVDSLSSTICHGSPVLISPANVKLRLMMISKWNKSHLLCANATEMEFFWHESDTRGGFIRLIPSGHNWQHDCECDSRSFPPRKWNINSERKIWTEKKPFGECGCVELNSY